MKSIIRSLSVFFSLFSFVTLSFAQEAPIRSQDEFWKKRLVNRINFGEKINSPMVYKHSAYDQNASFSEDQGMIAALLNGVKQGKYVAYHPEDFDKSYDFQRLNERMWAFEQAMFEADDDLSEYEEDEQYDDGFVNDSTDTWVYENSPSIPNQTPDDMPDLGAYEQVVHMVEDWIFDKNTSQMQQRIRFFEVIWRDPGNVLPEKVLCRFKWEDVKGQLDNTLWKNRFNDAETRSIKEVFTLRMFNSFIINYGGRPVNSLVLAQKMKDQLIRFEGELWSY